MSSAAEASNCLILSLFLPNFEVLLHISVVFSQRSLMRFVGERREKKVLFDIIIIKNNMLSLFCCVSSKKKKKKK